VRDTLELVDSLGREKGIWVGHDVGSLVVWTVASHHPERCSGVVSLCIPYLKKGFAADNLIPLVDRAIYPQDTYPAGQWDYILFYEEGFEAAHTAFEANTRGSIAALFRRGNAALRGTPSRTAQVRRDGGWFGGGKVPDVERDAAVLTEADLSAYTASLEVRPKCLVHEPQTERRLCSDLGQRRSIEHAGAVPRRSERFDLLDDSRLSPRRTDAQGLRRPNRSHDPVRPLDGTGVPGCSERCIGEVAGGEVAERLAFMTGITVDDTAPSACGTSRQVLRRGDMSEVGCKREVTGSQPK
jgi:hypothetical protein